MFFRGQQVKLKRLLPHSRGWTSCASIRRCTDWRSVTYSRVRNHESIYVMIGDDPPLEAYFYNDQVEFPGSKDYKKPVIPNIAVNKGVIRNDT